MSADARTQVRKKLSVVQACMPRSLTLPALSCTRSSRGTATRSWQLSISTCRRKARQILFAPHSPTHPHLLTTCSQQGYFDRFNENFGKSIQELTIRIRRAETQKTAAQQQSPAMPRPPAPTIIKQVLTVTIVLKGSDAVRRHSQT